MKKLFKSIILILTLTMLFSITVFAEDTGNGATTNEGTVDPHSSVSGFSKLRSGYLIYITDAAGTPVSDVVLVPFASAPASNVFKCLTTRVTGTQFTGIYNGTISTATNGGFNQPPLDVTTGATYGAAMKSWLLSDDDGNGMANAYSLIGNLFGESMKTAFKDNDYYLCVEAVVWLGLQSSSNPILICGSTKTLNEKFSQANSTYMSFLRQARLPHSGYLEYAWAGCSVPTIHSGTTESMADLTAAGNGYGIIMCRSSEIGGTIPDPPPDTEIATSDYLTANELNYAFPDFIVGTSLGRSYESYEATINMGDESVWKKHGGTLKDDKWYITETVVSDLVNFYGASNCLLYRPSAGTYAKPSVAKEFSGGAGAQSPGYAYMYSRALWGDNLTVCDYKGNGKANEAYITSILKLPVGHTASSGISVGDNVETKSSTVKSESYKFKGSCTEAYTVVDNKGTEDTSDDTYTNLTANYESSEILYSLTHGLYKYTPLSLGTPSCLSSGETLLKTGNVSRAWTKVVFASETGTVSLYPEVEYKMYPMPADEEWSNGETPENDAIQIYCMGEKLRSSTGGTLHGYNVSYGVESGRSNYQGNVTGMRGVSIVDAPLTGTAAFEWKEDFGDNSQRYMQVCAQGSGFEVASTNNPIITCTSFTLDLYDGNVSSTSASFNPASEWTRPDALSSHNGFVSSISNNLSTEVTMRRFKDSTNNRPVGDAVPVAYDISDTRVVTSPVEQIQIKVKDGAIISGKDTTINRIASAYGISVADATTLWNNWGVEGQILGMLETSATSNNNSRDRWYDEETECLAITVNKSVIQVGRVTFSDKMEYGSSANQDALNIENIGGTGYQCRFYFTLKFTNPSIQFDGTSQSVGEMVYLIDRDEIKGARFLVSNVTTNNWIK